MLTVKVAHGEKIVEASTRKKIKFKVASKDAVYFVEEVSI